MHAAVQVGRTGTQIAPPEILADVRAAFQRTHLIHLPAFFERSLLERLADALEQAAWELRRHVTGNAWASDDEQAPPADAEVWAEDLHMQDPAVTTSLIFLLNDRRLFGAVEAIAGCEPIQSFVPNVYKIVPGAGHYDDWHTDDDGTRMVALSVNMGRTPYTGGVLRVRRRNDTTPIHQIHNSGFGDALMLRIAPDLEHSLTPVTGEAPRIVLAGWFTSAPSPFPGLPA